MNMLTIKEPARDIKVINEVDIVVLGGSCTGVFAAVRASRNGLAQSDGRGGGSCLL